jgi:TolB-like protein
LNVALIIEGTVALVGHRARVNVQLLDAHVDRHLWAESLEQCFHDRLALQQRVAALVVAGVRSALTASRP